MQSNIISSYQSQQLDPWILKKSQNGELMLANVQNTAHIFFKKEIAAIQYQQTNAYFWKVSVGVVSLHIPLSCQNIELFEFKLLEEDNKIAQWQNIPSSIKDQIYKHCGSKIATKKNIQKGRIGEIGSKIGSLFGSLSKKLQGEAIKGTSSKIQAQESQKQSSQQQNKNTELKDNWHKVKDQVKTINGKLVDSVKPVRQLVSANVNKLGQKFNNSQNKIVKGIRDFGLQMKRSLNQGYNTSKIKQTQIRSPNQKPIESQRVLNRPTQ